MILALGFHIGRLFDENIHFFLTDRACVRPNVSRPRSRVAAQIRRPRSSRNASTAAYFSTIVASSSTLRLIGGVKHNTHQTKKII